MLALTYGAVVKLRAEVDAYHAVAGQAVIAEPHHYRAHRDSGSLSQRSAPSRSRKCASCRFPLQMYQP